MENKLKLSDIFQACRISEGPKYEVYVMSPEYSGCAQLVRGPVLQKGDHAGMQVGVALFGMTPPLHTDARFVGYMSHLPDWAEEEPKSIMDILEDAHRRKAEDTMRPG